MIEMRHQKILDLFDPHLDLCGTSRGKLDTFLNLASLGLPLLLLCQPLCVTLGSSGVVVELPSHHRLDLQISAGIALPPCPVGLKLG